MRKIYRWWLNGICEDIIRLKGLCSAAWKQYHLKYVISQSEMHAVQSFVKINKLSCFHCTLGLAGLVEFKRYAYAISVLWQLSRSDFN